MTKDFILASGSLQRQALLAQIHYEPKLVEPADIDETPLRGEKPSAYVKRMAREKALHVAQRHPGEVVLSGDTVVVCGSRILQKADNEAEQEKVMRLLSGRTHRVLSAVCAVDRQGKPVVRLNVTRVKMKKLSEGELKAYLAGGEWKGCSGYKIEGELAGYVQQMTGSYSGVVGLPLYETKQLLNGIGIR